MKFYSEVLDELFDTQEALEQAEAKEKAKDIDAAKEADIARIKDFRTKLDALKAEFEDINEARKEAELAFMETYGDDVWADIFATPKEKEIIEKLKTLKAIFGLDEGEKPVAPAPRTRVEVKEVGSDLGTAIHEFLKGIR